jgi:hypothetical protein
MLDKKVKAAIKRLSKTQIKTRDGSTILDIWPYTGKFPEYFTHVVLIRANTNSGTLSMAIHESDIVVG